MEPIQLTDVEKAAKSLFTKLIIEGSFQPCDMGGAADLESKLPLWFDDAKFKRGQKYFLDNRFGMMQSNFCGLITLLSEPKGLTVLNNTGRSSTPETARKRYISTIFHMLSWYEIDLSPGSKSWASLNRVRKMHLHASTKSQKDSVGFITQTEIALTTFGFMGYALIRPHVLGIKYDNQEDREALVHFWAVIGAMLGVQDQYNICLPELAVVETICQICLRYIFMPLLQLESPLFKTMVRAIVDGLNEFTPFNSYESMIWFVRRVAGIPGYQYSVDLQKETVCRKLYSSEELASMRKFFLEKKEYEYMDTAIFCEQIVLFDVKQTGDVCTVNESSLDSGTVTGVYNELPREGVKSNNYLSEFLELKHNEEIVITVIENDDQWQNYLNDSKLSLLSSSDLMNFKLKCRLCDSSYYRIGRFINETVLSFMLLRMRRAQGK
ncbi:uncharacterized protein LOC129769913 [Toxorhynchites rutilus septentrionalis]|uniref:uncharacterized protein LOC129769913 n=1 Tax=Toxorhynchites rutilus septentrionalis TaxID=329112 RepID=UPI00247AF67D|nr:uncharacterized protein LOC129769913 [Toxorhynchites rutilus septentrionalis]